MLELLTKCVDYLYPDCYVTIQPKEVWSIRKIDGTIVEWGRGFDKLYEIVGLSGAIATQGTKTNPRITRRSGGEVQASIFPYQEEQDYFDWMELVQNPSEYD